MNSHTHPPGLDVAPVFQDHAVLQRDIPIPVWGRAAPGSVVRARLGAGPLSVATTDDSGAWVLRLPPLPAGGPHELAIETDCGERLVIRDLLVGEVWICSGQSNMEFQSCQLAPGASMDDGFDLPDVRLLTVCTASSPERQSAVSSRWTACTPASSWIFSAVGAWFGRMLHERLGVPVGLIANAWGGSRIQAWLSREALMCDPAGRLEIAQYEPLLHQWRPVEEPHYAGVDQWFQAEGPEDSTAHGSLKGWHLPDCDDHGWQVMGLPRRWQDEGHDFNGVFWFRRRVAIPAAWQGRPLRLDLGAIDKHDETYVNGELIGRMGWENTNSWCTARSYAIPAGLACDAKELVIAVRVRSHIYHGGMTGPAAAMRIVPEGEPAAALPLSGDWRFAIEQDWGVVAPPMSYDGRAPGGHNAAYALFNSRLAPLIPYGIRGWIWYQGESNADEPELYRRLLPLMIDDWRRVWGQGELPFGIVQLANFQSAQPQPTESNWARLRAAQAAATRLPGVGMAVTIDVGEADDIHPRDKRSVGTRLAHWALADVYQCGGVPCGPVLKSVDRHGMDRLRLSFAHAVGLRTRDGGPVRGLAIAGSDFKFRWAEASITGSQLDVWHSEIPVPAAVRYAWADNPEGCNLVNGEDLPAAPFDTRELDCQI